MVRPEGRELVVMGVEEEKRSTQDGVGGEEDKVPALQTQEGVELSEGRLREQEEEEEGEKEGGEGLESSS
jgi:hypothetical protein|eukprot:evm.model.NODE_28983_length_6545_cov_13.215431.1